MGTGKDVIKYSLFSGLSFYLYNEASFLALERLSKSSRVTRNAYCLILQDCSLSSPSCSLLISPLFNRPLLSPPATFIRHITPSLNPPYPASPFRPVPSPCRPRDPQCGQHPEESGDHRRVLHSVQVTHVPPRYPHSLSSLSLSLSASLSLSLSLLTLTLLFVSSATHEHPVISRHLTLLLRLCTGGIGSGIAVLGTLLYSLAKRQYAKKGSSGH